MAKLAMKRIPTGIRGFDDIIEGGFPEKSIVLVTGTPGTAKTIFGLQYIANGARDFNEKGVYISLEEKPEALVEQLARFGYDLDKLVADGKIKVIHLDYGSKGVGDPYSRLKDTKFISELKSFGPKRAVIDSISLAIELSSPEGGYRRAMGEIAEIFRNLETTSLFLHERKESRMDGINYSIEEFLADGIVHLQLHRITNSLQRFLTVIKMRNTKQNTSVFNFLIDEKGIKIFDLKMDLLPR